MEGVENGLYDWLGDGLAREPRPEELLGGHVQSHLVASVVFLKVASLF